MILLFRESSIYPTGKEITFDKNCIFETIDTDLFQKASFIAVYDDKEFYIVKNKHGEEDVWREIDWLPSYVQIIVKKL